MSVLRQKSKKHKFGFTMAELLIVLAIIAILMAIAIPSIISVSKRLKTTELDSAARSIFIAAQSHMSNMRRGDYTVSLSDSIPITSLPEDFPVSLEWDSGDYRFLSQSAAGMKELLPIGAIDQKLLSGTFFVEYNANSGMVYAVFYAESAFSYSPDLPRDEDGRRKNDPQLGYYGGSNIDLNLLEDLAAPEFIIRNDADSLRVEFVSLSSSYTYSLEVSDGITTVAYDDLFTDSLLNGNITLQNNRFTIILDELSPGSHFFELFPEFSPGTDLTITLTVSDPNHAKVLPASTNQSTNSLFASRNATEANVTNIRHLQNLHYEASNVAEITSAIVGDAIDATGFNFTPIIYTSLVSFNGNSNEIRGLNKPLFDKFGIGTVNNVHLVNSSIDLTNPAAVASQNIGTLVNTADGTVFSDCRAYADGGYNAATLTTGGALNTGGLIGLATNCNLSKCFASLDLIRTSTGNTGGLIGKAENASFSLCYADTGYWDTSSSDGGWHTDTEGNIDVGIISASGTAGGFAGLLNGGGITNCYSVGSLKAASGTAASFAGSTTGSVAYSNCYGALRFIDCNKNAVINGFTNIAVTKASNCHFLKDVSVTGQADNVASYAELAVCMKSGNNWRTSWGAGEDSITSAYGLRGASLPFPAIIAVPHYGDWEESSPKIYYYELYSDGSYGFHANIRGAEYSSLLASNVLNSGTIHIVEDGYALLSDTNVAGENITINYNATKRGDSWSKAYKDVLTAEEVREVNNTHNVIAFFMRPQQDMNGVLETIVFTSISSSPYTANYTSVTVNGVRRYFFPAFSKCAINGTAANQDIGTTYEIRTARQLSEIQRFFTRSYALTLRKTYNQTVSIDFTKYKLKYTLTSIGGIFRNCVYDGGGNIITGTDILPNASGYGGFIATADNNSVIKNIVLVSDLSGTSARTITGGSSSTGGIVGALSGNATIENCVVSGFNIVGGSNVGGIVGLVVNATIRNCSAVCYSTSDCIGGSITSSAVSDTIGVGGIAGTVTGSAIINNTYSIVSIPAECKALTTGIYGYIDSWIRSKTTDCYGYTKKGDVYLYGNAGPHAAYVNTRQYNGVDDIDFNTFAASLATPAQLSTLLPALKNTHTTCDTLSGLSYPYPSFTTFSGQRVHFGNWDHTHKTNVESGLYYYELYANGSYGYSGPGLDSLRNDLQVAEDGYAVIFDKNSASLDSVKYVLKGSYNTTSAALSDSNLKELNKTKEKIKIDGEDFTVYYMRSGGVLSVFSNIIDFPTSELMEITIKQSSGGTFTNYFNPHYAKTASLSKAAPTVYEIRTARHLFQLSQLTNNYQTNYKWSPISFTQTRSVNFNTYTTKFSYKPISANNSAFTGAYDGNNYSVTGLSFSANGDASSIGLIGVIGATGRVSNLNFSSCSITSNTNYSGILAGKNEGTVTNCTVNNSSIDGPTGGQVGGLVGSNSGTITASAISNTTVSNRGNNGTGGGFAGTNTGTITDCSTDAVAVGGDGGNFGGFIGISSGTITNCTSLSGSVNNTAQNGTAGGFAGQNQNGGTISNCFAAGHRISGLVRVGGFVAENNGTIEKSASSHGSFGSSNTGGGITIGNKNSWGASAGGFVSRNTGTIMDCYAISTILSYPAQYQGAIAFAFSAANEGSISNIYCITQNDGSYLTLAVQAGHYSYNGSNLQEIIDGFFRNTSWGFASANNTVPYDSSLSGAYPLPTVFKNSAGEYVHYGNWPAA